jgi:hypothetical protein
VRPLDRQRALHCPPQVQQQVKAIRYLQGFGGSATGALGIPLRLWADGNSRRRRSKLRPHNGQSHDGAAVEPADDTQRAALPDLSAPQARAISIARDKIVFTMEERTGNIWMGELDHQN